MFADRRVLKENLKKAEPIVQEVLERLGLRLDQFVEWCQDTYFNQTTVRAMIHGTLILLLVIGVDRLLNFPVALRVAYLAPLFYATQHGGKRAGAMMIAVISVVGTFVDAKAGMIAEQSFTLNFCLRAAILTGMMFLVEAKERKFQQTLELATTDALTGAKNRMAIEQTATREVEKCLLENGRLVLAMLDCDKFKTLNDTYGHAFGDQVLKTLVRTLGRTVNSSTVIGRNGGDEFLLLFPDTRAHEVAHQLERAMAKFSDSTLVMGCASGFSYGLASFESDGVTVAALMEAADKDMYLRKIAKTHVADDVLLTA